MLNAKASAALASVLVSTPQLLFSQLPTSRPAVATTQVVKGPSYRPVENPQALITVSSWDETKKLTFILCEPADYPKSEEGAVTFFYKLNSEQSRQIQRMEGPTPTSVKLTTPQESWDKLIRLFLPRGELIFDSVQVKNGDWDLGVIELTLTQKR